MNLLLIGGTGNLSSECASALLEAGHEITVLTRGRTAVPKEYRAVVADRKNPDSLRAAVHQTKPEVVIDFLAFERADVQADADLFQGRVRQFIFISTATVYAKPPQTLPITEESPLGNIWSEYARKKLVCEQFLLDQWRTNQFPVTIIRPSHTYSRLWVPNPVSSASYTFASRMEQGKPVFVANDGENPWTLTAASDFAAGVAGLVGNSKALGEAVHITSDEALTWNQICAEIASALGVRRPKIVKVPAERIFERAPELIGTLKGDKMNPGVFDNSKIKRLVPGFVCRKPFAVGIRESVAFLRAHPEFQNLDPRVDARIEAILK